MSESENGVAPVAGATVVQVVPSPLNSQVQG